MRKILFLLCLLWLITLTLPASAQVRSRRFGQAQQLGHSLIRASKQPIPTLSLPAIDAAPLLAEDAGNTKAGRPFRFGLGREVDVDVPQQAARWTQDGYRLYAYRIDAAGAFSINLIFDRFRLKPGSTMFLYNGDRTMLIGPITDAQNPNGQGEFWTDLVEGSNLTIEIQEPIAGEGQSELHLKSVVHGYKDLFPDKAFGQAGACHLNLTCYPDYQFQGDGVALILLGSGTSLCTGSLVNTTRQSFRSFLLTAFHALEITSTIDRILQPNEIAQAENWLVRFNYQSATCAPSADDLDVITLNGTIFRAGYANSDVVLLELRQQVPPEVNPTYNGWNRADETTANNATIHHPRGDVKKISFTNADTQISGYQGAAGSDYLISLWGNLGVTDPGSSGSPLFDSNRRIVGQLRGGPSVCGATGNRLRDYYGRVFSSWTGGGTSDSRLSNWLDPGNLGLLTTNGAKPILSGPTTLTGSGIFSLNTLDASVVSWSVAGGAGLVSPTSGGGSVAQLLALGTATSLTLTFSVNDGQTYPIQFSQVFSTSVTSSTNPAGGALALLQPLYNCATGAITFQPTGGDGTTIIYTAVGVQRSSLTNPTGTVESGLRSDPKPLVIVATQSGLTVSQSFEFAAYCNGLPSSTTTAPPTVTVSPGGPLTLLQPTYNCATGAIAFQPTGGDGTIITYTAVGVRREASTSTNGVVEVELRSDPKPLLITATQSGVVVSQTFDFADFCGTARFANAGLESPLRLQVLGNPTTESMARVQLWGVGRGPLLVRLINSGGQLLSEKVIEKPEEGQVILVPSGQATGFYLVQVQTGNKRASVRLIVSK